MQLTLEQKTILVWKVLKRRWPELFRFSNRVPLAIGIREQILAEIPTMDAKALNISLRRFTKCYRYQKALASGADRINLDGSFAGPVLPEQRECAARWAAAIEARKDTETTD